MSNKTEKLSSADFHKTPIHPRVVIPDKLTHANVEAGGRHSDYSKERKRPDAPEHGWSRTQRRDRRQTCS